MIKIIYKSFPVLFTERLKLRKLKASDRLEIFKIRSNENITKFIDRPLCTKLEEAGNFISRINKGIKNREWYYWAIVFNKSKILVGTICLWNFSEDRSKAEIGFELLPEFQGKGIMQEAVVKILDYGFNKLNLNVIEGEVVIENLRSIKLLEKNNFKRLNSIEKSNTVMYRLIKTKNKS